MSAPKILMPTGVRTPVVSMSMRALIGIVQALVMPGSCSASFISLDELLGRDAVARDAPEHGFSHSGAQSEYQRVDLRHSSCGFSTTMVSIIENGAGIGRGVGAARLPEHALDFGEAA